MDGKNTCACGAASKLIFACSGAADVGAITDQAARKLMREGKGKMFCTAGIGGRVGGIIETTKSAAKILAVDGCPMNCAKNSLEQAGFANFAHLQLADLGMAKGKTAATDDNIALVAEKCAALLEQKGCCS